MTEIDRGKLDRARNLIRDFGPPKDTIWVESRTGIIIVVICCALSPDYVPVVVYSDFDQAWTIPLDDWNSEVPGSLSPVRRFVPSNRGER